jgi:hypothetical protein
LVLAVMAVHLHQEQQVPILFLVLLQQPVAVLVAAQLLVLAVVLAVQVVELQVHILD